MSSLFQEQEVELHVPRVTAQSGYEVIYADPPWHYNPRRASASKFGGGACFHYPLMTDQQLLALPVQSIAAQNSVLFLWATWPRLPLALQLISAWGFEFKTCALDWFKVNPKGGFFFGVGYYSKSNSEPCLLATRGKPLKPATNAVSMAVEDFDYGDFFEVYGEAFKSIRREHSRKPDEVRRRIEEMYPSSSRVELFARQAKPGWDVWGNEVKSSITLAA